MVRQAAATGIRFGACLACLIAFVSPGFAQSPEPSSFAELQVRTPVLSLPEAVRVGLENNPALAAQRKSKGIAAARLVIAETYPFNPTLETRVQYARGPEQAGVTNKYPVESLLLMEVELHGQGKHRREAAAAALSRTEWEVAAQEQELAGQVVKAYTGLLYRQEKLRLAQETLKLNEQFVDDVRRLVRLGRLRGADLISAETEVADAADAVGASRESLAASRQDLLKTLGLLEGAFDCVGTLESGKWGWDAAELKTLALERRADLKARNLAVAEAAAGVRLAEANRFGNPTVGPAYSYDPSKVRMIGAQVNLPLPVANSHRGEVLQSAAEHAQAQTQLRQSEFDALQDVAASTQRVDLLQQRAEQIRKKLLPDLERAGADMEKLFQAGEPGVDVLKVIDVRRKVLKARDNYLDLLWALRQARADVIAATGEPALEWARPTSKTDALPPATIGVPRP
jgi:cobalt-zinc-cadmium efflux system outer membrane protein